MHHHYHTVADLLKDESFTSFCRRQNERDIQYWEKYITDNPDKKQLIEAARREYLILFTTLANADLEEQMQKLRLKIDAVEGAPVVPLPGMGRNFLRRFRYAIGSIAIVLLAAGYFFWNNPKPETLNAKPEIEYASQPGERKSFQLPDGTQVSLNAGSSITVDPGYGKVTREISLIGEAFFEVQHNKQVPFIVHTNDMDVKALGTAFNVRSYAGEKSEAALLRGLVEVTLKKDNNRKILLHPEEKISWAINTKNTNPAKPPAQPAHNEKDEIKPVKKMDDGSVKEVAWMENKLVFEDEPFEEIVPQLMRWYDVEISFGSEDVKHYHFTATFKKEKLEQVLEILRTTRSFKYRIDGKMIVITK